MASKTDRIHLHEGDLPDHLNLSHEDAPKTSAPETTRPETTLQGAVAIDTETMGLDPHRDRLCLVQIASQNGHAHLVRIAGNQPPPKNLAALLADQNREKIFHFARFDVAVLQHNIGPVKPPLFCTKIASKLARTYTDRHGLADLVAELLGISISKAKQSSDWGAETLDQEQMRYAANDVIHLHQIREKLQTMLEREGRSEIAHACFDFLNIRCRLDLDGFGQLDIFAH